MLSIGINCQWDDCRRSRRLFIRNDGESEQVYVASDVARDDVYHALSRKRIRFDRLTSELVCNEVRYQVTTSFGMRASHKLWLMTITQGDQHFMYDRKTKSLIPYDRQDLNKTEYGVIHNGKVKGYEINIPSQLCFAYRFESEHNYYLSAGTHSLVINPKDGTCMIHGLFYQPLINLDTGTAIYFLYDGDVFYFDYQLTPHLVK